MDYYNESLLPEITEGSEKQIKYATAIRARYCHQNLGFVESLMCTECNVGLKTYDLDEVSYAVMRNTKAWEVIDVLKPLIQKAGE